MRPTRGAFLCALLALIGIGLSSYLVYLHLGLLRGELLGGAACSGSGAFNCHAVTGGAFGSVLGMPLALWGVIGYVAVLALSLMAQQSAETSSQAMTLVFLLAAVFVGIDAALFGLMAFVIRFYCLFCLLTYAVNLCLLCISSRSLASPTPGVLQQALPALGVLVPSSRRPAAWLFWGMMAMGACGAVSVHAATAFVSFGSSAGMQSQLRTFVSKQSRVSIDVTGDPRIGSTDAPFQLVEFSDFFCPACQRASKMNPIILASHRRDASFVFKHYPLDTACNDKVQRQVHPGACQVAAASECAHLQDKFWPFHDLFFEKGHDYKVASLDGDAQRLGLDMTRFRACLESGQGMEAVKRDIAEAAKFGVQSTPTYVINGIPMAGGMSPAVFEETLAVLRESDHR